MCIADTDKGLSCFQVQQQLEAREEVIGIVVNPLLEPELTTPLLDVQGELRRGYSQS